MTTQEMADAVIPHTDMSIEALKLRAEFCLAIGTASGKVIAKECRRVIREKERWG